MRLEPISVMSCAFGSVLIWPGKRVLFQDVARELFHAAAERGSKHTLSMTRFSVCMCMQVDSLTFDLSTLGSVLVLALVSLPFIINT